MNNVKRVNPNDVAVSNNTSNTYILVTGCIRLHGGREGSLIFSSCTYTWPIVLMTNNPRQQRIAFVISVMVKSKGLYTLPYFEAI